MGAFVRHLYNRSANYIKRLHTVKNICNSVEIETTFEMKLK